MGSPPHLVLSDPSRPRPSLSSLAFSSDSCTTSPSLSFSDSSSSSFNQSFPSSGDLSPSILKQGMMQHLQNRKQYAMLDMTMRHKNCAGFKQESSQTEPFRECKTRLTSCSKGVSTLKACCGNAGAFTADCAAVSCCPCAVLSLLSFALIDIPSALARKMVGRLQIRLCRKDARSLCSRRGRENSLSMFTRTWSRREASDNEGEKQAVTVVRLSTENLVQHFHAENVGFGCLSQTRK